MSLVLPLDRWPEADRFMWAALRAQGGPLDDQGALAHLRETSLQTLERRYGRWLCWLGKSDPTALQLQPAERATTDRLKKWLEDLAHTAPMSRLMFVDGVLRILCAAAPQKDWTQQRRLRAGLKQSAGRGDRRRKEGRVLSTQVLLAAGLSLATDQSCAASTPLEAMKRLRDGAMIAVLALMPMRRRAFTNLEIGRSLLVTENGFRIAIAEELMKTGVPWEADVPQQLVGVLQRYLSEARRYFLARGGADHRMVWVTRDGQPFEENYLGQRIARITLRETGKRVPPHLFRDAAATTLARSSPQAARLIRPILAHSGFETANRHYNHAKTIEAGRDYGKVLDALKKGAK